MPLVMSKDCGGWKAREDVSGFRYTSEDPKE